MRRVEIGPHLFTFSSTHCLPHFVFRTLSSEWEKTKCEGQSEKDKVRPAQRGDGAWL